MTTLWRGLRRVLILGIVLTLGLVAPVAYVETMCQGAGPAPTGTALIAPEHHRPESRTLMTYPEWHIVHAYADYAQVIATDDPHDYAYAQAITGFWTSLCALTQKAGTLGEIDSGTKQMVYVIGVSFTAELAAKALYEETLGRLATMLRGPEHSATDRLSAAQAADYAEFLQQVPWYKWRFREDAEALQTTAGESLRDTERRLALGLEYRAKAAYARAIAQAVSQVGPDALTLRMIVADTEKAKLEAFEGVKVTAQLPQGFEVEVPRYRALTRLLGALADQGATFVEIAGNDDILFTALSSNDQATGAIHTARRQGFDDYRHLIMVKVSDLADTLRSLDQDALTLEHIHDY